MTAPAGDPAYNPATWKLGYQTRQFGYGQDPMPTGGSTSNSNKDVLPSVYGAMATPPANMTTAAGKALGVTQSAGKSTAIVTPDVVTTPSP